MYGGHVYQQVTHNFVHLLLLLLALLLLLGSGEDDVSVGHDDLVAGHVVGRPLGHVGSEQVVVVVGG